MGAKKFLRAVVAEVLGYGDVKGKDPADKDYQRLLDIRTKAGNNEAKVIALVQKMADAIGRGGGSSSREKAHRRAVAAERVFPGSFGKKLSQIFMKAA